MLSRIEVRTSGGTLLNLSLEDVFSGYVVQDVEGLDPVKSNLVSSPFANMDGEQLHSSRRDLRNIVLRIGIEPDYVSSTVQDLRNNLYNFFMPKSTVSLTFVMHDGKAFYISGMVETCEAALFTREPTMAVSITCFDPDFVSTTPTVLTGVSTNSMATAATNLDYDGTVEAPVKLSITVNRTVGEITVYHTVPSGGIVRSMEIAYPFLSGDVVTVVTTPGKKSVTLLRTNVSRPILYATPPRAYWMELEHGRNTYRVYVTGTGSLPYQLEYTARYGGL